ncbi:PDZ domain-containing protein [Thalassoglobus polymorphus]|uniref:Periplasmic serine endoprotease DegP n=1 Tax=Thalassoglobus polymorphus TaxID=2527994 RepID=A0A517QU10_9PLAN|nr:PDZ domain-containing protein [Thalassoglobus polymorphus]QDT35037.1 Periplasmic serine endoprotease DegP precursor [Thalassoglobus polymorphus]
MLRIMKTELNQTSPRTVSLFLVAFAVMNTSSMLQAQPLFTQEQQAIQQATAFASPSIVRIETVGGQDLVGDVLTGTGPTTGVIVSDDGYIITSSFNFVSDPASVLVTLIEQDEEKKYAAEIVASDQSKMLTLLKVEASGLKPISVSPKGELKVGQRAIALGRTFNVEFPNISIGIVSALNRVNGKAIQTDAKTSPVNYGGPLIDLTGQCMGILVPLSPQQAGETAGVEWYDSGIGFAIPLEDIQRVLDRMKAGEDLQSGLLGVGFEAQGPLTGEAKILRVRPQSPADQAGLKVDDVVIEIDEHPVNRLVDLRQKLGNRYAGEKISLIVKRGDETIEREIQLAGELLAYEFTSIGILPARRSASDESPDEGVLVRFVYDSSPAQAAGMKLGDRIRSIDGQQVSTPDEISVILTTRKKGEEIAITLDREEETQTVNVTLEAFPDGDGLTNIPPSDIPPGDVPEELKLGRSNQKLAGSDRSFWVFVPENYNPNFEYGLLMWVHPSGETMEADVLKFWKDLCTERGIILVGPRAEDLSGWAATDEEYAKDVVNWVQENYAIDSARVAVMGAQDSGVFATRLAFKYRDLFRGLISIEGPLRFPPPDSNPEQRLLTAFVAAPETRQRDQILKSVELLRKQKFPTAQIDSEEEAKFSFDLVNALVQWLDGLDRL